MALVELKYKNKTDDSDQVVGDPIDLTGFRGKKKLELKGTSVPYEVVGEREILVFLSQAVVGSQFLGVYVGGLDIREAGGLGEVRDIKEIRVEAKEDGDFALHLTNGFDAAAVAWFDLVPKNGELISSIV